jgi:hypothetical protein
MDWGNPMKIAAGLAFSAILACSLAAFADTPAKLLYKRNGDVCTAAEAAGKVKETYRGRTLVSRVKCYTAPEWKLIQATSAEAGREWSRYRSRLSSGAMGEGLPAQPQARALFRDATSPPAHY